MPLNSAKLNLLDTKEDILSSVKLDIKNEDEVSDFISKLISDIKYLSDENIKLKSKLHNVNQLSFELNTVVWKEKKKSTNFNAWELAVDSIRKEIILRIED